MVRLIFAQVTLRHERRCSRAGVREEKVHESIVVIVGNRNPHRVAVNSRIRIGDILELHIAEVLPRSHLPRVVRDDEVFVAIVIDVGEDGLEGVVLVSQTRRLGRVRKRVVAVVDQQRTAAAVTFLIENIQTFNQLLANVCLLYTSPSPRDATLSRMPSSA